ncbi:hypothetical protein CLV49_0299 [Labedella gwakjiensis]|uniref:DUF4190 domain-containing protein n=1 Tax=Labedella gwakjiensis TaxID=390269 RepID=A0A2P8GRW4_9MICO|nr:hypothetical protein [Labedella gwakjiensis]PSL36701.1 hypothetical protein CLV49_0299 [Labedella gwakjiensis]
MSGTGEWGRGPETPPAGPSSPDPFVPPSNPAFGAPRPSAQGAPPSSWPSAGSVAFTPSVGAPTGSAIAALVLAIVGAVVGLAIGWGFPLSVIALVLALKSRAASRTLATWSIVLVAVSALGSIAWLVYSAVYLLG